MNARSVPQDEAATGFVRKSLTRLVGRSALCAAAVLSLAAATGCDQVASTAQAETITVATEPEASQKPAPATTPRVVALGPASVDILLELGVEPVGVAELPGGDPDRWPDPGSTRRIAMDHATGPNLETMIALDPELVLTTSAFARFSGRVAQATGADVVGHDVLSLDALFESTIDIGERVGQPDRAERIVAEWREHIAAIVDSIDSDGDKPLTVLGLFGGTRSYFALLPESYFGSMVGTLGAELVDLGLSPHRFYREMSAVSLETIVAADPDVIIVFGHGGSAQPTAAFANDPAWNSLSAVANDRIHALPDSLFIVRPGAEPVHAAELLAEALFGRKAVTAMKPGI